MKQLNIVVHVHEEIDAITFLFSYTIKCVPRCVLSTIKLTSKFSIKQDVRTQIRTCHKMLSSNQLPKS